MSKILHGIVHGKTIQFDEELGVAEGQVVEVQLKPIEPAKQWGDGIRRSAGGWAEYPEMDAIMGQIQLERKRERRAQEIA